MASTYTPSLTLTQIGNGEQSGTWGTTTNTNWQLIEDAVAGVASVSISGTSGATLSVANGTTDQARKAVIVVTGAASGVNAIVAPLQPKVYLVSNQTTGGFAITIGASTGSTVSIPNGVTTLVYCDGTNFYSGITGFTGGNLSITGNITASGTVTGATFATSGGVPQLAGGAANQIHYQTGANATSYITAPANDVTRFLAFVPGTGFQWQTSSTTASNINGGGANQIVYQTGANTTSFITAPASANQVLTWNGSQILWQSGGAVASVGATSPLASSGGTTPNISLTGVVPIANGGTGATSFAAAGLATTSSLSGYAQLNSSPTFTGTVTSSGSFYSSGNTVTLGLGSPLVSANTLFTQFFPNTDNYLLLGSGGNRWAAVYAVNGTIQTSDGNEKQQVRDVDAAEKAVGQSLKSMMKAFKFNDAVEKKGENARIHFGVLAQDVKAVFESQGLDADKYGVFCSDTWYEVNGKTHDEEGLPYQASAPSAVERTRLGVRYDELFALVIAAL